MKTERVFGIRAEAPCPACASPRVGIDQDDTYTIVPGVVPGSAKSTRGFDPLAGCPQCNARYEWVGI